MSSTTVPASPPRFEATRTWVRTRVLVAGLTVTMVGPTGDTARAEEPAHVGRRPLVILVRPADDDPVAREVLSRVRGELNAAGFEVLTELSRGKATPRDAVETAGGSQDPAGALALVLTRDGRGDVTAADLWVSDRASGRTSVERTLLDAAHTEARATALAVRAAELLRVSLAPSTPAPPRPATTSPPPTVASGSATLALDARTSAPATAPSPWSWSLGLGASWLGRAVAGSSSWQALGRIGWRPAPRWEGDVVLAFPLDQATTSGAGGRAQVSFLQGAVGASRLFGEGALLRPWLGGHLGLLRVRVSSDPGPAYLARSPSAWASTVALGGGVALRLGARVTWRTGAELELAWPRLDVRVGGTNDAVGTGVPDGATVSWPAVRLSGALEVTL